MPPPPAPDLLDDGDVVERGAIVVARESAVVAAPPDLFADPLVADIRDLWRLRQRMVEARRRLTLQGKAACRFYADGDKAKAAEVWKAAVAGHGDMAPMVAAFLEAMAPLEAQQKAYERQLRRIVRGLPVHGLATAIRGVNEMTLAAVVGELGALTAYEKGVAGMWKRAGLAVIDGGRQRRVAGDAALLHGYDPARRSVVWNVAAALFKAQSHPEPGPWRQVYDARRAIEDARCASKAHAHARALRFMSKAFLRHLRGLWAEAKR